MTSIIFIAVMKLHSILITILETDPAEERNFYESTQDSKAVIYCISENSSRIYQVCLGFHGKNNIKNISDCILST